MRRLRGNVSHRSRRRSGRRAGRVRGWTVLASVPAGAALATGLGAALVGWRPGAQVPGSEGLVVPATWRADMPASGDAWEGREHAAADPAAIGRPARVVRAEAVTGDLAPMPGAVPAERPARPRTYWLQVGAFRESETADRLASALRQDGWRVALGGEGPRRPRYRVRIPTGEAPATGAARLGALGASTDPAEDPPATPALPLREAVETARRLREAGLPATVETVVPAPLRVVRAGPFSRPAEAEAARAGLEAAGIAGFVVGEPS